MPNKTPIIDAHVHCWSRWPETMPKVFTAEDYGSVKWLLHEMQKASVDRAVIVCAEIAPDIESNQYAAKCHKEYPGKFYIFADLDSFFWPTYGKKGAADRLRKLLDSQKVHGLSQYWFGASEAERFLSKDNLEMLDLCEEKGLPIELGPSVTQFGLMEKVVERIQGTPILFKHMGILSPEIKPTSPEYKKVLQLARYPNVYAKISEFMNAESQKFAFPYRRGLEFFRALYEEFGPDRLIWGTDWPLCYLHETYQQALEVVRSYADFIPADQMPKILGGNLQRLVGDP